MALLALEEIEIAGELPRVKWTRRDVEMLAATGIFNGRHYELIDGDLIDKTGKKRRHVNGIHSTTDALKVVFGTRFVNQEAPIDVASEDNPLNEPEPDVIVLRRPYLDFTNNPGPEDIALAVEVADTTLRADRTKKARLYARAGIPEYWVLDVVGRRLFVYREPTDGCYGVEQELAETDAVRPLASPEAAIAVAELLPWRGVSGDAERDTESEPNLQPHKHHN